MKKKRVLILCTGNSARSQMAEGILRHMAGDRIEVFSAGVEPSSVRPEAVEAMGEIDIDISSHRSKSVDEFTGQEFDHIITVCDNADQNCPTFPGKAERVHWSIADPVEVGGEQRSDAFRQARDELLKKLTLFANGR